MARREVWRIDYDMHGSLRARQLHPSPTALQYLEETAMQRWRGVAEEEIGRCPPPVTLSPLGYRWQSRHHTKRTLYRARLLWRAASALARWYLWYFSAPDAHAPATLRCEADIEARRDTYQIYWDSEPVDGRPSWAARDEP